MACHANSCTCGCEVGAIAPVPGLAESCEKTLFANTIHFPKGIALSEQYVYWTEYGHCPLSGADTSGTGKLFGARRSDGSAAMVINNLPCPSGVTAIDDDVYWTNHPGAAGGSIWAAKSNGEKPRILADKLRYPTTIRADADHVYWYDSVEYGVYRISRTLAAPYELFAKVARAGSSIDSAFVIDERYVYWLDDGEFDDGGLFRADKSGGNPELIAAIGTPRELAISSEGLFWVEEPNYDQYAVFFLGWSDAAPTLLTSPSERPQALVAFDRQAYWSQGNYRKPGGVFQAVVGQSQTTPIADAQSEPGSLAIDADFLFWTNHNFAESSVGSYGQLMRMCRP